MDYKLTKGKERQISTVGSVSKLSQCVCWLKSSSRTACSRTLVSTTNPIHFNIFHPKNLHSIPCLVSFLFFSCFLNNCYQSQTTPRYGLLDLVFFLTLCRVPRLAEIFKTLAYVTQVCHPLRDSEKTPIQKRAPPVRGHNVL